jgi:hypothetical protein
MFVARERLANVRKLDQSFSQEWVNEQVVMPAKVGIQSPGFLPAQE